MTKEIQCFHCGEDCDEDIITLEEKNFCCNGCKMVYQLLSDNNLDTYYKLEHSPGNPVKSLRNQQKFAYLDIPEAKEELLDFSEGGVSKIVFSIPKIHCTSCVYLLENLPRLQEGVTAVMVDFVKRTASVTFHHDKISLRQLVEFLGRIGYSPDLTRKEKTTNTPNTNRSLLLKIGLAGFCFGNIMLLSFPEYLAFDELYLEEYKPLFGGLSFALALPVLFYCAQDYFISAWANLRQRFIGIDVPIVLGIIALFGRSSYEIFTQTGAGYMDSFAGLIFFLLIGKWYQSKTYQALSFERDYTSYFPVAVSKVEENEKDAPTMIQQLEKGDIIKIRNQEIIPSDSILLSEHAAIDYSFVSGESDSIPKQKGDKIYAGGRQVGGAILLEITKKVDQSYFTQLWNQRIFEKDNTAVLSRTVDTISKYFTIAILLIASITLTYWLKIDSSKALMAFSSVLIIACPCALALSAPFAFGNILRIFGKRGFFLKNALTVEQLSNITDIIFDKTGTLTTNSATRIQFEGDELTSDHYQAIRSLAQHSTHPLSQMLYNSIEQEAALLEVLDYKEISGQGIVGWIDGSLIKLGSAHFVGLNVESEEHLASQVYVYYDSKVLGYFNIDKQYRKGINQVLKELDKGFNLHLLSGDNDSEKEHLKHLFKGIDNMHFHQAPIDKLNYIKALQENGKKVLMIGDGLNDAGALQQAEVGVAISDDVYSFSPASDAILDAKEFAKLDHYVKIAKDTLNVVRVSFLLSLLYNTFGLYFAVQGELTPLIAAILMPLSSITVVLFVTIMTNIVAKK